MSKLCRLNNLINQTVELLKVNPEITVAQIAFKLGITLHEALTVAFNLPKDR